MSTKRQLQKNDWKGKVHEVLRQSKLSSTLGEIKHQRVHTHFFRGVLRLPTLSLINAGLFLSGLAILSVPQLRATIVLLPHSRHARG